MNENGYASIAHIYDVFNSDVDYEGWADFAEFCFEKFLSAKPSIVLDLACGTGTLTSIMSARGYDMIGIDLSPEMLGVARENCPTDVLLLNQDICSFELYGTVGATICSLDSINHLCKKGELDECFFTVHQFLDPDGLFVFDVNSEHRFENDYAKNSYQLEGVDDSGRAVFCNWQNNYSKARATCRFSLSVFTETLPMSDIYIRRDEEWTERCYSKAELTEALQRAGFELCAVYGSTAGGPARRTSKKLYFVARAKK